MAGCFGRLFRCARKQETSDDNESTAEKTQQESQDGVEQNLPADGSFHHYSTNSSSSSDSNSIGAGAGGDWSWSVDGMRNEVEALFDALHKGMDDKDRGPLQFKTSAEEVKEAFDAMIPRLKMDYEEGTPQDLLAMYTFCTDIMAFEIFDQAVCQYIVLTTQRMLIWDVLPPTSRLLSISAKYLDKLDENNIIVKKTRTELNICKAELLRREGRLNDSLQVLEEVGDSYTSCGEDAERIKAYLLTVQSMTLANMLQKTRASAIAETVLKSLRDKNDSFYKAIKSELAFIIRFRNPMFSLKVLQDVCGIVSVREGDERSVRVRNARLRLGMWHFLDGDFDYCVAVWKSVFILDIEFFFNEADGIVWPLGVSLESVVGLHYLGMPVSVYREDSTRNVALRCLMCIHFTRQRLLGFFHPSARFIEVWLQQYVFR